MEEKLSCELSDILNRIKAYNISNPDAMFLFAFVGFKKNEECVCEECGGDGSCVDDSKTHFGAVGDLENLRDIINDLRNVIEDNSDRRGMVNF